MMETALLNTALGMGTVFAVLIFISFVISLLGLIPKLMNRKKEVNATPAVKPAVVAPVKEASNTVDDSELIAVIAAAVATTMSETTGQVVAPDGLIIRSIKKRR